MKLPVELFPPTPQPEQAVMTNLDQKREQADSQVTQEIAGNMEQLGHPIAPEQLTPPLNQPLNVSNRSGFAEINVKVPENTTSQPVPIQQKPAKISTLRRIFRSIFKLFKNELDPTLKGGEGSEVNKYVSETPQDSYQIRMGRPAKQAQKLGGVVEVGGVEQQKAA